MFVFIFFLFYFHFKGSIKGPYSQKWYLLSWLLFILCNIVIDFRCFKNWNSKKFQRNTKILISFLTIYMFETLWLINFKKTGFYDVPVISLLILWPPLFFIIKNIKWNPNIWITLICWRHFSQTTFMRKPFNKLTENTKSDTTE